MSNWHFRLKSIPIFVIPMFETPKLYCTSFMSVMTIFHPTKCEVLSFKYERLMQPQHCVLVTITSLISATCSSNTLYL